MAMYRIPGVDFTPASVLTEETYVSREEISEIERTGVVKKGFSLEMWWVYCGQTVDEELTGSTGSTTQR
jgi:hypothetical protein